MYRSNRSKAELTQAQFLAEMSGVSGLRGSERQRPFPVYGTLVCVWGGGTLGRTNLQKLLNMTLNSGHVEKSSWNDGVVTPWGW